MDTQELVEMWSHYQNVVLHYSDITFQFRLAFIGSLSFLAGLIIYLFPFRGVEKELDRISDSNLESSFNLLWALSLEYLVLANFQYIPKCLASLSSKDS